MKSVTEAMKVIKSHILSNNFSQECVMALSSLEESMQRERSKHEPNKKNKREDRNNLALARNNLARNNRHFLHTSEIDMAKQFRTNASTGNIQLVGEDKGGIDFRLQVPPNMSAILHFNTYLL
eukprot:746853_1